MESVWSEFFHGVWPSIYSAKGRLHICRKVPRPGVKISVRPNPRGFGRTGDFVPSRPSPLDTLWTTWIASWSRWNLRSMHGIDQERIRFPIGFTTSLGSNRHESKWWDCSTYQGLGPRRSPSPEATKGVRPNPNGFGRTGLLPTSVLFRPILCNFVPTI
jgi:hypothetical protein